MWEAHNWSKGDRLWIGLFTLLPVAVGAVYPVMMLVDPGWSIATAGTGVAMVTLAFPVMVLMLMLLYLPAVVNNRRLGSGVQTLWIVGFFTAGLIALPWYWYVHIWKAPYAPDADLRPRTRREHRDVPGGARQVHSGAH